jgi:hypothetical protein
MIGASSDKSCQAFDASEPTPASFLRCRTFQVEDFRRQQQGRTVFVFDDSTEPRRAILNYANDGRLSGALVLQHRERFASRHTLNLAALKSSSAEMESR